MPNDKVTWIIACVCFGGGIAFCLFGMVVQIVIIMGH